MRILVTGAAGFIGFHVAARLLARGEAVTGFDNVNDYYDVALKEARLAELDRLAAETGADWRFLRADLADRAAVDAAFDGAGFERVIHLAAQAGVRYSLENPLAYVESNVTGFAHLLEACRQGGVGHLSSPRPRPSTAPIPPCPSARTRASTIRCSSMPRPSARAS